MSWRIVHIKEGNRLSLKLTNIEVVKNGESIYIPLQDISIIILEGQRTTITTRLLAKLSEYNIALITCNIKYEPIGIYLPLYKYHRMAKRHQMQIAVPKLFQEIMWSEIIQQKLDNQYQHLQYWDIAEEDVLSTIEKHKSEIALGDRTNKEAIVAKLYFNALFYKNFTREDENGINAGLNFGYTILRTALARLVIANGLIPCLGIHHCNEYNEFNLVDDLMEPFRPFVDYYVQKEIVREDVRYLNYEHRLAIIDLLNQPMRYKSKICTLHEVMQKYVASFVKSLELKDEKQLIKISLDDFISLEE